METRRLPIIAADKELRKAAEVMLANRAMGVVTLDVERRPQLVLTFRRLVRAVAEGTNIDKTPISEVATYGPVVVHEEEPVLEALAIMRREGVRFLPVVDDRVKLRGIVEPRHIAFKLWSLVPYGAAVVEPLWREPVVLPGDATLEAAAKAMNASGATEVLVKVREGEEEELRVLREWDFLEALAKGADPSSEKISKWARGEVIKIPAVLDARSAVELMAENDVLRLFNFGEQKARILTITDLAFALPEVLEEFVPKEIALVLISVEPGREIEVARRLSEIPEVTEVLMVPGEYDNPTEDRRDRDW
jgi:CBS domain-containing protein